MKVNEIEKERIKEIVDLIYGEQDYATAEKYIEEHIGEEHMENLLFRIRVYADSGRLAKAIQLSNRLAALPNKEKLFYLLEYTSDSLILNIVNIGHTLRSTGFVKESDTYMRNVLNAQMERKMVNRTTVVQSLLNTSREKQYLEIGVFVGQNFLQIQADRKIAVDPVRRIKHTDKFPDHVKFYELPSDEFYETEKQEPLLQKKADVVFVDGLHTYEQSLRDVLNTLNHLKDDGIIIMHDCFPRCFAAAHPIMEEAQKMDGFKGFWNGDVFKAILWMRANRADLEVFVLDTDHGLGMVTKRGAQSTLTLTDEEILAMDFHAFDKNHTELLNLKDRSYFWEWSKKHRM